MKPAFLIVTSLAAPAGVDPYITTEGFGTGTTIGGSNTDAAFGGTPGTWVEPSGLLTRSGGQLVGDGTADSTYKPMQVDLGTPDQIITATFATVPTGSDNSGLLARGNGTTTYYQARITNHANLYLIKTVAAADTTLAGPTAVTCAANDIWEFSVIGTSLVMKQNGTTRASTTDSAIASGNYGGFIWRQTNSGAAWDNFYAQAG